LIHLAIDIIESGPVWFFCSMNPSILWTPFIWWLLSTSGNPFLFDSFHILDYFSSISHMFHGSLSWSSPSISQSPFLKESYHWFIPM
jgi:hypothetical protein